MSEETLDFQEVAGILQQRIGQIVANHEGELAMVRQAASQQINALLARVSELEKQENVEETATAEGTTTAKNK